MDEIIEFLSNPTGIGILALAILGVLYLSKEFISFLQGNILPDIYKKWLERQNLILPFAEKVLDRNTKEPDFFRAGNPKYIDFERKYVMIRPEIELIKATLKRNRFALIEGLPSSGKSITALTIAYQELKAKHTVIYFSRPTLIPQVFIGSLINSFKSRLDKKSTLIIVDDVHLDVAAASKLFEILYANFENINLLFISRPLTIDQRENLDDWQFSFTQYMPRFEMTADHALPLLAEFYSQKKFGRSISPIIKNGFMDECGNDLLLLSRYLVEWDGTSPVNMEIIRKAVFTKVRDDLEKLNQESKDSIKVLLVLGVFYRFEIQVESRFFKFLDLDISFLAKRGEVKLENDFVRLYHSSLAKLYSNAIRSLELADYASFSAKYTPFPFKLFKEYVLSLPRNFPEMIIGLRPAGNIMGEILGDEKLTQSIKHCIEIEQNLNLLGWALIVMKAKNGEATWRILQETDFYSHAKNITENDDPSEVTVFIYNLSIVSDVKLKEWLNGIAPDVMAKLLLRADTLSFAFTLLRIKKTDNNYYQSVIEHILPMNICEKFFEEQNFEKLRTTLAILPKIMEEYVDIRAVRKSDFIGEVTTKISLYVKNKRVSRTFSGKSKGIPYSNSLRTHRRYEEWVWKNRNTSAYVLIDKGAEIALTFKRASLFPVGIMKIVGDFSVGDIIELQDIDGKPIGAGIINYSSADLDLIKGLKSNEITAHHKQLLPNRVIDNDLLVLSKQVNNTSNNSFE